MDGIGKSTAKTGQGRQEDMPKPSGKVLPASAPRLGQHGGDRLELTQVVVHGPNAAPESSFVGLPTVLVHQIVRCLGFRDAAQLLQASTYFEKLVKSDSKLKKSLELLQGAYGLVGLQSETLATLSEELRLSRMPQRKVESICAALACLSCGGMFLGVGAAFGSGMALTFGTDSPPTAPTVTDAQTYANYERALEEGYYDHFYNSLIAIGVCGGGLLLCGITACLAAACKPDRVRKSREVEEARTRVRQTMDQTASLVFHLGAGGSPESEDAFVGDSVTPGTMTVNLPAISAGVRELLAAPESILPRQEKVRFLEFWKTCRWESAEALTSFLTEIWDSPVLTHDEKHRICVERIPLAGRDEDEVALIQTAMSAALDATASEDTQTMRRQLGRA